MTLFRSLRVKGGGLGNPYNAAAQTAFDTHAALEEGRALAGMAGRVRAGLSQASWGSVAILMAAVVVWIGFALILAVG
ncbi:MAG: hypothetical protein ACOYJZ_04425 [Acutalibacter sp.]|jgi:hypothetical protein